MLFRSPQNPKTPYVLFVCVGVNIILKNYKVWVRFSLPARVYMRIAVRDQKRKSLLGAPLKSNFPLLMLTELVED